MTGFMDSAVFIWLCRGPEKLSARAREFCENRENELLLSIASIWEIQIKILIGKLEFDIDLEEAVRLQQGMWNFQIVGVELRDVYGLKTLPPIHKDPFDRILIAQARELNAAIVSSDDMIAKYPVTVIW